MDTSAIVNYLCVVFGEFDGMLKDIRREVGQRLGEPKKAPPTPLFDVDEPGLPQYPQVSGDRRTGQTEQIDQLAVTNRGFARRPKHA
ncbi:hypothetical protein JCM19992_14640 [Thermostilla marina]